MSHKPGEEPAVPQHTFDQQDPSLNFAVPRSAPSPQHGRQPDKKAAEAKEPRSFKPRPGH